MLRFAEIALYVGVVFAALAMFITFTSANGAPQEAAGFAMAIAFVAVPYCLHATLWRVRQSDRRSD